MNTRFLGFREIAGNEYGKAKAVTAFEGGRWELVEEKTNDLSPVAMVFDDTSGAYCYPLIKDPFRRVHSIKLTNDREWDCVNGWRDELPEG